MAFNTSPNNVSCDTNSCDGKCLRSFHATVDDGAQSQCESLGFTKAQVKVCKTLPEFRSSFTSLVSIWFPTNTFKSFQAMKNQDFYCKNCEYQQHQCYACGELGSSDQSSHAEVL